MDKTSSTHPLRVDWIAAEHLPAGALGMTFAPGKVDPTSRTGPWARDLDQDLERLARVDQVDTLVSILEPHELGLLHIPGLGAAVGQHGLRWLALEVVDGSTPDASQAPAWLAALRQIRARLLAGERVVVHCRGGLGRTGTFVAALLTSFGASASEAIAACRAARPGTVENSRQARFVEQARAWWRADLGERVRGCLVGGAVGDALGAAVEFDSLAAIRRRHGSAGVRELERCYGGIGRFTDDTQMTLFTAEGLLRAAGDGLAPEVAIERALWRWLWTQGDPVPRRLAAHADGWLFAAETLHAPRAPGNTCLSALRARVRARSEQQPLRRPLNSSKGCGGVMRVAPAGIVAARLDLDPWTLGCDAARLTHEHPAGWDTAGLFAEIIATVLDGADLARAVTQVWARRRDACHLDTRLAIDAALTLVRTGEPADAAKVESLGAGWVAEEALAIALYCALAAESVEDALSLAVTHSGDSDSTGAIVGNLLGAARGAAALPPRWVAPLEFGDGLVTIADDLTALRLDGAVPADRYPPTLPNSGFAE